jgi:hypothetical protein
MGLLLCANEVSSSSADTRVNSAQTQVERVKPILPPRLSIIVLPFANLSGDPEQEYFADGVTESLTTDLSRISGSFVIGAAFASIDRVTTLSTLPRASVSIRACAWLGCLRGDACNAKGGPPEKHGWLISSCRSRSWKPSNGYTDNDAHYELTVGQQVQDQQFAVSGTCDQRRSRHRRGLVSAKSQPGLLVATNDTTC